jgi:hypothetical protein
MLHKLALFTLPILIKEAYLIQVCYIKDVLLVYVLCTFVQEIRKICLIFMSVFVQVCE